MKNVHYIKVMKNDCFLKDPEKIEQIGNIPIEKFKQFETEILESIHCTLVDTSYDSAIQCIMFLVLDNSLFLVSSVGYRAE